MERSTQSIECGVVGSSNQGCPGKICCHGMVRTKLYAGASRTGRRLAVVITKGFQVDSPDFRYEGTSFQRGRT